MDKLEKSKLWILVGIPGSGKSTWIQNHKNFFGNKCGIVSRDEIRFSLLEENDDYFAKEKDVWIKYVNDAIISLKNNTDTILDATHLNESSRAKILRALKDNLNNVEINAIVIDTPLAKAIKWNDLREGRKFVPHSIIRRMNSQMTMPNIEEGFDTIYIYKNKNGKANYKVIKKGE